MNKEKILFIDIETFANEGYFWNRIWKTNIIEIIDYMNIISFSAKWLGGKHITKALCDYPGYRPKNRNDKKIVKDIYELVSNADIVIGQNLKKYDLRVLNSRFLYYGLTPPTTYKVVDTKTEAKKILNLPSYSLNDIADYFGFGHKLEHEGWRLWKKCYNGDKSAWTKMKAYNRMDVILLEKLYLKLRPYIHNHPTLGMFRNSGEVCPNCGSNKLQSRGFVVTKTSKYRRFVCTSCGSWGRSVYNIQENKPIVSL